MAQFGYEDLGKNAKAIGFDGVDLTVRAKGHVLPERVTEDLPRAVRAIRAHGLSVPMITTGLLSPAEPAAVPTLKAAAAEKIPFWKPGYYRYKLDSDVEASVAQVRSNVAGLAALSKEYGVVCGLHNHSGDYFGAAVWDTRAVIADLEPKIIGYYFDPAHATIEGGLAGWRISMNLVLPRLKMVALKDFYWNKSNDGAWKLTWCPMGEGMVDWKRTFGLLAKHGFRGPLTLHVEYHTNDELAAIAKDYEFIRKQMKAAFGA